MKQLIVLLVVSFALIGCGGGDAQKIKQLEEQLSKERQAKSDRERPETPVSNAPKYDVAKVEALKAQIAEHRFTIEQEQSHPGIYHSAILENEQRALSRKENELQSILSGR